MSGERDGEDLVAAFGRLYVPKKDARWLRRNAVVAAGNVGTPAILRQVEKHAASDDAMLAETAAWALARIDAG